MTDAELAAQVSKYGLGYGGAGNFQDYDPATNSTYYNYWATKPLGSSFSGQSPIITTTGGSGSGSSSELPGPVSGSTASVGGSSFLQGVGLGGASPISMPAITGPSAPATRTTTSGQSGLYSFLPSGINVGYGVGSEGLRGVYTMPNGKTHIVSGDTMNPLDYLVMSAAYGTPSYSTTETEKEGAPGEYATTSTDYKFDPTLPQIAPLFESSRAQRLGEAFKPYAVGPGAVSGYGGAGTQTVGSRREVGQLLKSMWR